MDSGAILVQMHCFITHMQAIAKTQQCMSTQKMHTTQKFSKCYSHPGFQSKVASSLPFYNPFVIRFRMLHCRCLSATSFTVNVKMHFQKEVAEGQCRCCKYFMLVMMIPQWHCVWLHLRNHGKDHWLEKKHGWEFVVFHCELNHDAKLKGGSLLQ